MKQQSAISGQQSVSNFIQHLSSSGRYLSAGLLKEKIAIYKKKLIIEEISEFFPFHYEKNPHASLQLGALRRLQYAKNSGLVRKYQYFRSTKNRLYRTAHGRHRFARKCR